MKAGEAPVVTEQVFDSNIETAWWTITDVDLMRQWYFESIPDFKAEVGFETEFTVESGNRQFPHARRVTEVVPPQRLVYDWSYNN